MPISSILISRQQRFSSVEAASRATHCPLTASSGKLLLFKAYIGGAALPGYLAIARPSEEMSCQSG
jgi:hypothetical protein